MSIQIVSFTFFWIFDDFFLFLKVTLDFKFPTKPSFNKAHSKSDSLSAGTTTRNEQIRLKIFLDLLNDSEKVCLKCMTLVVTQNKIYFKTDQFLHFSIKFFSKNIFVRSDLQQFERCDTKIIIIKSHLHIPFTDEVQISSIQSRIFFVTFTKL